MLGKKLGDYPTGYFETPDGRLAGLRIVSATAGMGDREGYQLLTEVTRLVEQLHPKSFAPDLEVGFAGDIPNAVEEQQSLVSEAVWVTALAALLILGGVVFFYRSPWSLVIIGVPALFGASVGYAFAAAVYGYVNTVGAFLGAIIIGNGVNYPIVLLSRYRDFSARGIPKEVARREAVLNAFRTELVGASVASIAYGSLTVTRFRGFSQFGTIGFLGMLAVWAAIVPLVPALVVLVERLQARLPSWLRDPPPRVREDGATGPVVQRLARVVGRYPIPIVAAALVLTVVAACKLPNYLRDPWEYNFSKLGSEHTHKKGAGRWSSKADRVFGGRANVAGAMMVADSSAQVPLIKRRILEKDIASGDGRAIDDVVTVWDLLPGSPEEQHAKLGVIERLRGRLTPRVLSELDPKEKEYAQKLKSQEKLGVIGPEDLPPLLQRRFEENNGTLGTVYYVKYNNQRSLSDGHNLLQDRGRHRERGPAGRDTSGHRQPLRGIRRNDPVHGTRRAARHLAILLGRGRRGRVRHGQSGRRGYRALDAGLGGVVDGGRHGAVRREAQFPELHRAAHHLRHRLRVPVQSVRSSAAPGGRRGARRAQVGRAGRPLQLHHPDRLRVTHFRRQPGAAIIWPRRGRRGARLYRQRTGGVARHLAPDESVPSSASAMAARLAPQDRDRRLSAP